MLLVATLIMKRHRIAEIWNGWPAWLRALTLSALNAAALLVCAQSAWLHWQPWTQPVAFTAAGINGVGGGGSDDADSVLSVGACRDSVDQEHLPVFCLFPEQPAAFVGGTTSGSDFLGTQTRSEYFRGQLSSSARPGYPTPSDADYWRFAAVLWAAKHAALDHANSRGKFSVLDVGAGWAPWTVRAALAWQALTGSTDSAALQLLAVEPEPTHCAFARQHLADNGLGAGGDQVVCGAVYPVSGLYVPFSFGQGDQWYGQAVVSGAQPVRRRAENATVVAGDGLAPTHSVASLLSRFSGGVDLLLMDVDGDLSGALAHDDGQTDSGGPSAQRQSLDYAALASSFTAVDRRVRMAVIRTSTRQSHAALRSLFRTAGWLLAMDYEGAVDHAVQNLAGGRAHDTGLAGPAHRRVKFVRGLLVVINPATRKVNHLL